MTDLIQVQTDYVNECLREARRLEEKTGMLKPLIAQAERQKDHAYYDCGLVATVISGAECRVDPVDGFDLWVQHGIRLAEDGEDSRPILTLFKEVRREFFRRSYELMMDATKTQMEN